MLHAWWSLLSWACLAFLFVFSGRSSLSESGLVILHWDAKSIVGTKRVYQLVINECVKLVVES